MGNTEDWLQHLRSPHTNMMKKYMWELIGEHVFEHENTLENICNHLYAAKEVEAVAKMFASIYESGYRKCVADHQAELDKLGLTAQIVPQKKDGISMKGGKPIFHEKSG